ncbi:YihY family inner membrane protein [Pelagibius sp. Alg239-R121]|uniref:YihY family inner membrane protein n=1 Tax=Pelagibius sp. Alg239-R121 TaxID=2993448 RepID=UPI0024A68D88|nr:YihY family inner membrane protein [Pelagibius sp. Alg239-R121]
MTSLRPVKTLRDLPSVALYAGRRFLKDSCPRSAAALSYSSLLAMVPLLTIALTVLSAFPTFSTARTELQSMVFSNFLPDAGIEISDQLTSFIENATQTTGIGVVALAATALLLLSTITSAFNAIWRAADQRSLFLKLLVYWALLTLGPLLIGASLSLSSIGFAMVEWSGIDGYTSSLFFDVTRFLPAVLSAGAFTLLYIVVPYRPVRVRHALFGAVVAAFLFEVLKKGFALYLTHFPSYQALYGALAAVPIFLVWMYLSWAVILFGAEIAASLPEWRANSRRGEISGAPGARLALGLSILARLHRAAQDGRKVRELNLVTGFPAGFDELADVLHGLRSNGFVSRTSGANWVLSRDLSCAKLKDLMVSLDLTLDPGEGWPENVGEIIEALSRRGDKLTEQPLAELLSMDPVVEPLSFGRPA